MYLNVRIVAALLTSALALTCSSPRSEIRPRIGEMIPPGHCRIAGTVVAIDSSLRSSNPSDPCAQVPCRAQVRIDQILGYGPAFPQPLAPGEVIAISFAFTTAPTTKELFPSMQDTYPGVTVGSRFVANLNAEQKKDDGVAFTVYGYQLQ